MRGKSFLFRSLPIHIIQLITSLLPNASVTIRFRGYLISKFLGKCGKNFKIASGVILNHPEFMNFGSNVYLAHNVWINANGGLILEDNVQIGPFCVIATSKHVFSDGEVLRDSTPAPVYIHKGTWLASHVVITDGVVIGEGVTVAAGAVVAGDLPAYAICGGIPAKVIKYRMNYESNRACFK